MNNKIYIIAITLFTCCITAKGQQAPVYSHYMFGAAIINPAAATWEEIPSLTVLGRYQWAGVDGAPRTAAMAFSFPLESGTSLGTVMHTDRLGNIAENSIALNIAQKVPVGEFSDIALGLRIGSSSFNEDNAVLNTSDPVFRQNRSYSRMNLGFGAAFTSERFFVGLSAPEFRKLVIGNNREYQLKTQPHFFLQSAMIFDMSEALLLKPGLLLKGSDGAPLQLDLGINALFNDTFWAGIAWRSSAALTANVQAYVNDYLQIGYAYDQQLSGSMALGGAHELLLKIRFIPANKPDATRCPFY